MFSVYHKFEFVTTSPVTNQFPCCPGRNKSSNKFAVKIERALLSLKLDVEVWRIMISKIHPDNNPEKS